MPKIAATCAADLLNVHAGASPDCMKQMCRQSGERAFSRCLLRCKAVEARLRLLANWPLQLHRAATAESASLAPCPPWWRRSAWRKGAGLQLHPLLILPPHTAQVALPLFRKGARTTPATHRSHLIVNQGTPGRCLLTLEA